MLFHCELPRRLLLGHRIALLTLLALFTLPLAQAQDEAAPGGRGAPATESTIEDMVKSMAMVDMPLDAVLKYLEQLTGKAILRSQSLPGVKINFDSLGPMTKEEAILAVESLLALNGVIITPVGDRFLKAVGASQAGGPNAQVPIFIQGSSLDLKPSQAYYTKYFRFDYLDADTEGKQIVQGLATPGVSPVAFPKNNAMLVTDSLINLQRIEEVLIEADNPATQAENVFFFSLSYIKASDLSQRLQKLTQATTGLGRYFANNTTFEADERTNQLIVVTHPSNEPILRNLIAELDKDIEPITSSEVFYIKHAQATDIDALLEEVINGQQNARENSVSAIGGSTESPESNTAPGPGGQDALVADTAPLPEPTQGISAADLDARNLQFSDFVTIVADERSNAIVVYGTKSDIAYVERLIEQIDVLLAQVYIEVLIAEVTLTDDQVSGFSALSITGASDPTSGGVLDPQPGADLSVAAVGNSSGNLSAPFDLTLSLSPDQFRAVIRSAESNSNVRILSVPNIVTTHNQEANVNVSQSQPIITSTVSNLSTGSASGTTSNDVQFRDIGIQLTVKPLIGSNGIIQMEIEQIVENVVDETEINGIQQPIIGKREATSFISVADGQVIVLAGLQATAFSTSDGKLWGLGYIPIIGDLFNPKSKSNERRELMIFIRPTVYFGPDTANEHARQITTRLDNGGDVDTFLRTNDMTEVTREQQLDVMTQEEKFNKLGPWPHPLDKDVQRKLPPPPPPEEPEPKTNTNRSPYRGN